MKAFKRKRKGNSLNRQELNGREGFLCVANILCLLSDRSAGSQFTRLMSVKFLGQQLINCFSLENEMSIMCA